MSELISVIMPCYNGETHLLRSIESALGQTYANVELLVIDDGSTDGSRRIMSEVEDSRIRVFTQLNQGVCSARNRGLAAANGDFIAFLDADDTWHPMCLEKLHAAMTANPQAAIAYCGWQNLGLAGSRTDPFVPPEYEGPDKVALLVEDCRWPIHAALTRRSALTASVRFDERYPTSEDFYFWLKIACKNPICRVPEVLAFYHHHQGSRATRDAYRMARNHWLVQREFLRQNPEVADSIGLERVKRLTHGHLLERAYVCWARRDLRAAQKIYRLLIGTGYAGGIKDWKRMAASLLPFGAFRRVVAAVDRLHGSKATE